MLGGLLKLVGGIATAVPAMNTARWKALEAVAKSRILNALTLIFGLLAAAIAVNDQFIGYYPPGLIIELALNSRTLIYTAFLTLIGAKGGTAALTVKQRAAVANALAEKQEQAAAREEAARKEGMRKATSALVLKRNIPAGGGPILGELGFRKQGAYTHLCYTLELPWRNNQRGVSCIPAGVYALDLPAKNPNLATKLKYKLYLLGVLNRSGIALHGSDSARPAVLQIRGCILVSIAEYVLKRWRGRQRWHSQPGASAQAVQLILKTVLEHQIQHIIIEE